MRNLEKIINMVRNKNTLSEKILMAFTSFWAKLGISGAFIVGVFAFGRYYQERIMIRNEAQRECIFNEKLYHYQRENLTLQDKCNQLKQEIKELNFQIRQNNGKR